MVIVLGYLVRMVNVRLSAVIFCLLLLTACAAPSSPAPVATDTPVTTPTTSTLALTLALTSTTPAPDFVALFPPRLAKDFYPGDITREMLLARLPQAVRKTGVIGESETWDGVIRITGDLQIPQGVTVTVKPGTLIFVAAGSDDQKMGATSGKDHFNPKKPICDEAYTQSRVAIGIDGALIARGTKEEPIIITSDALTPQTDDWIGIQFSQSATGELERVIIEYDRIIGISSNNVMIKQAIIRNMLESIVIMGQGEELLTVSPTITESYIYNIGQMSITIRSGAPVIISNIIRPRQDLDLNLPGFEYGAIAVDHPAQPTIMHNFLEGGAPLRYDEYDNSGIYHEFIMGTGLGFHASIAPLTIAYNTFYNGGNTGLEVFPSPVTIEHNNFIDNATNLQVQESLYEPSDAWQQELFAEGVIKPLRAQEIQATNNYWGTVSLEEIGRSVKPNGLVQVALEPFASAFIKEALPPWSQFPW